MKTYELLAGRILMAQIFLMAGISKLGAGYGGTQAYMESMGVPGMLLPAVIALELLGGIALVTGWFTRHIAWALAIFSVVAAVLFHANFSDQIQTILFMKNLALAGGLLVLASLGAGTISLDHRFRAQEA